MLASDFNVAHIHMYMHQTAESAHGLTSASHAVVLFNVTSASHAVVLSHVTSASHAVVTQSSTVHITGKLSLLLE